MNSKIIFKVSTFPTISETFVVNNVVEAIKKGFEVCIVAKNKKPIAESSQQKLLQKYKMLDKTIVFSEPKGKVNRYLKAIFLLANPVLTYYFIKYIRLKKKKNLTLLFNLYFYLPLKNTTVFHVHFANAISPLLDLKKIGFLKSKIIVTFHGYDAHYLPKGEQLQQLLSNFNSLVNTITVNSDYLKQKLIAKGFEAKTIVVVPMQVNTTFFKPIKPKISHNSILKLVTVGRLVDLKGVHLGLEVVQQLIKNGNIVNYTIVGEGQEYERLKSLAKSMGIQEQVYFLGSRSQSEIKSILNKQHVFLMTSTVDKDDRREAFGVVSLEAQAMELPIVGFNSGGFPETLIDGETGYLVPDQDTSAMTAAVEKFINNSVLLQQMGHQARQHVISNFSFEKTIKKYIDLY